ncbi:MAG: hypothetical protein NC093_05130 [Alistipes sp.]|nr:hypothetical protein [Alistipes sp.]
MIVLKILLWIILAVLALILLIMILPVSVRVGYVDKKVILKVKYAFINVFELGGKGVVNRFLGKNKKSEAHEPEPTNEPGGQAAEEAEEKCLAEETEDKEAASETEAAEIEERFAAELNDTETWTDKPKQVNGTEQKKTENVGEAVEKDEPGKAVDEENKPEKEKGGKSITEKIDFVHDIWHAAGRPALKIFKGFKFSEFYVDFLIANQDAYKCALNYGRISGALYYVLGWFGVLFNMKYKTVDVNPGFDMKDSRWDVSFKLSFNIINVVVAGLWFLITYIFKILIPSKRMKKKMKKAAMQK